ncbi:MAG: hypothetical protein Q6373_015035 [Candidatus Sigynarchaeota archaeon]
MTKKNPLIEVLEDIRWNMPAERKENVAVIITHRGARNDVKSISMPEISRFDKGYIYVKKQEDEKGLDYDDEVPIPLHRVVKVVDGKGKVLYEKMKGEKKDV